MTSCANEFVLLLFDLFYDKLFFFFFFLNFFFFFLKFFFFFFWGGVPFMLVCLNRLFHLWPCMCADQE